MLTHYSRWHGHSLSGTDIGTAGAVDVPRWFFDAGNECHTCYTKRCHPCRAALKRAAACWLHSDMLPHRSRWRGWSVRHRYPNPRCRYSPSLVLRRWQRVPHMPHEPLPYVLCALKRAAACWLHSDMLPHRSRWRGWSVGHRYCYRLSRYCPSLVLRRWQRVPHMPHEPLPTVLCRPEACCCVLATLRHVAALLSMA
jgi:hypothetical protein